jgi:hypothetical protein
MVYVILQVVLIIAQCNNAPVSTQRAKSPWGLANLAPVIHNRILAWMSHEVKTESVGGIRP